VRAECCTFALQTYDAQINNSDMAEGSTQPSLVEQVRLLEEKHRDDGATKMIQDMLSLVSSFGLPVTVAANASESVNREFVRRVEENGELIAERRDTNARKKYLVQHKPPHQPVATADVIVQPKQSDDCCVVQ
jgi:hypothetical protein